MQNETRFGSDRNGRLDQKISKNVEFKNVVFEFDDKAKRKKKNLEYCENNVVENIDKKTNKLGCDNVDKSQLRHIPTDQICSTENSPNLAVLVMGCKEAIDSKKTSRDEKSLEKIKTDNIENYAKNEEKSEDKE